MRVIVAFAVLLAGPVWAENVLDSHFGNRTLASNQCFVRSYTQAHLAKHPEQQVTQISVMTSLLGQAGRRPTLMLFVKLRGDPYYYSASADCKTSGQALNCQMEADAGGFRLTGEPDGVLRLTVGRQGIGFEGDRFVQVSGTQGDDRVFLIPNVDADFCN